jgi:hypothetical protein
MSTRLGTYVTATPSLLEAFMASEGCAPAASDFDLYARPPILSCGLKDIDGFVSLPVADIVGTQSEHHFTIHGVVGINRDDAQKLVRCGHAVYATLEETRKSVERHNSAIFDTARRARATDWVRKNIPNPVDAALSRQTQPHQKIALAQSVS